MQLRYHDDRKTAAWRMVEDGRQWQQVDKNGNTVPPGNYEVHGYVVSFHSKVEVAKPLIIVP